MKKGGAAGYFLLLRALSQLEVGIEPCSKIPNCKAILKVSVEEFDTKFSSMKKFSHCPAHLDKVFYDLSRAVLVTDGLDTLTTATGIVHSSFADGPTKAAKKVLEKYNISKKDAMLLAIHTMVTEIRDHVVYGGGGRSKNEGGGSKNGGGRSDNGGGGSNCGNNGGNSGLGSITWEDFTSPF